MSRCISNYLLALLVLGVSTHFSGLQGAERPERLATAVAGAGATASGAATSNTGAATTASAAAGVAVSATDTNDSNPLLSAVASGRVVEVARLLDSGLNINSISNEGYTLLIYAAGHSGSEEIVEMLLARGADVNQSATDGNTALITAAEFNEVSVVQRLLNVDHINIHQANHAGNTALFLSSSSEIIAELLAHGADTTAELQRALAVGGHQASLALRHAVAVGAVDLVAQLLQLPDIDVNIRDCYDRTPLILAIEYEQAEIVQLLLKDARVDFNCISMLGTPLLVAVECNNQALVELLLTKPGVAVNHVSADGETALAIASNLEMIQRLLAAGADENLVLAPALTPSRKQANHVFNTLRYALLTDRPDWISQLLAASPGLVRAKVEHLLNDKNHINALKPSRAMRQLLADSGVSAIFANGFINVASRGNERLVDQLLLLPELNINAVNQNGDTALMLAAFQGHSGIVQCLLKRPDILVNYARPDGLTALTATYGKRPVSVLADEIATALIRAGAEIPARLQRINPQRNERLNLLKTAAIAHTQIFITAAKNGDLHKLQAEFQRGLYQQTRTLNQALQALVSASKSPSNFTAVLDRLIAYGANLNDHILLQPGETIISHKTLTAGVMAEGAAALGPEDFTPLDFAILADRPAYVVDALLKRGARSDQLNQRSRLYLAEYARNVSHPMFQIAQLISDAEMASTETVQSIVQAEQAAAELGSAGGVSGAAKAGGTGALAVAFTVESERVRQYARALLACRQAAVAPTDSRSMDVAVQCDMLSEHTVSPRPDRGFKRARVIEPDTATTETTAAGTNSAGSEAVQEPAAKLARRGEAD